MNIEIDYREKYLIELFEEKWDNKDIKYNVKTLDIGDIVIKDKDDNVIYIIERKTIDDLACSIMDGRYKEQKQRLLSNYSPNNIIYIVEGDNKLYSKKIPYKTIMSSIISMNLRDNINVLRTKTLEETYTNILLIIDKLVSKKIIIHTNILNVESNITNNTTNNIVDNLIKVKKKDNMNENVYYLTILSQIPGCSITTAKKIQEEVSSIIQLYELYKNNNTDIIKNIKIGKKKIGEKLTNRIFQFLFNDGK